MTTGDVVKFAVRNTRGYVTLYDSEAQAWREARVTRGTVHPLVLGDALPATDGAA